MTDSSGRELVEREIEEARKLVNPIVMVGDFDDDDDELTPSYPPPSKYDANKAVDLLAGRTTTLLTRVEALEEALRDIADLTEHEEYGQFRRECQRIARSALKEPKGDEDVR